MKKVLILYGWHGSDHPHWQDWLAKALTAKGDQVSFPQLSDNLKPQKEVWIQEAKAAFDALKPDTVVLHSMGNTLWMHLCEAGLIDRVERLLMVAPPRDLSNFPEVSSFFPAPKVTDLHADKVLMVVSDNDPYMTLDESRQLQAQLEVPMKIVADAGHINSDSGYGAWPWVLDWVEGRV